MRKYSDDGKVRRHHRVQELVRQELSAILSREVKDPRVRSLTITEVLLKPDLKSAIVRVCKFMGDKGILEEPTAEEKQELMDGLQASSHFVYERLKRALVMKVIPSIRFEYDHHLAEASRLWSVVKSATEGDAA